MSRIKELAEQAGYTPLPGFDFANELQEVFLNKFAKLIVRECCQAFETEVDTWKQMDPYQGGMKRAGTKAIKQHFGVE